MSEAPDMGHFKYCLYFNTDFGKDPATAEMIKGLKSAVAKNLFSADQKVSCAYIKDVGSDWACIRLLFSLGSEKAIRYKKLMKSQILALEVNSITTIQPANVSLYSKVADHDYTGTIRGICEAKKAEKK